MKEFQLENIMSIFDCFYFLIYENYNIESVTLGLRSYPSVIFKNSQTNIRVVVCGSDLGCDGNNYEVYITKNSFFRRNVISVSEKMGTIKEGKTIQTYSEYIQQHLMPVVRGEKWV